MNEIVYYFFFSFQTPFNTVKKIFTLFGFETDTLNISQYLSHIFNSQVEKKIKIIIT